MTSRILALEGMAPITAFDEQQLESNSVIRAGDLWLFDPRLAHLICAQGDTCELGFALSPVGNFDAVPGYVVRGKPV